MKRFITLILILSLVISLSTCLTSCDRDYDGEEVRIAAIELIEKSLFLNEIYWGEGIPYTNPGSSSLYGEADAFALTQMGFSTVEELKAKTREVFTEKYCEDIFSTSFSSAKDGEEIEFYSRYYQKYEDAEQTIPVCIMVYSRYERLLHDDVEYLYDTLVATHSKKDTVYVKVKVRVIRDEEHVQEREKVLALVEEKNGWRLDSASYLNYNDRQDEYQDLTEKK